MALCLRAQTALEEDPGSVPSTHVMFHNLSSRVSCILFFWPLPAPGTHTVYIHTCSQIATHIKLR